MHAHNKRPAVLPLRRYPLRSIKNHVSVLLAVGCLLFLLYTYRARHDVESRHGRAIHHPPAGGLPVFRPVVHQEDRHKDEGPRIDLGDLALIAPSESEKPAPGKVLGVGAHRTAKGKPRGGAAAAASAAAASDASASTSASPAAGSKKESSLKDSAKSSGEKIDTKADAKKGAEQGQEKGTAGGKEAEKDKDKGKGADKAAGPDVKDKDQKKLSDKPSPNEPTEEELLPGAKNLGGKLPSDFGITVDMIKKFMKPKIEPPGNPKGLTTTIVVGRVDKDPEGVRWIKNLKDITHSKIYIVDDPKAPLHLDRNKGRESAVYLKYIIEHYDKLDDVTIFFHSSRKAWHNNALFEGDGAVMIDQLRREHVLQVGYFNMRCELYPGCQRWIKFEPTDKQHWLHPERGADMFTKGLWKEMFPNATTYPDWLAEPCCSQFAASREMIRSWPLAYWTNLYEWLTGAHSKNDLYAGRIMEYVWQYVFLAKDEHCPSMKDCYCKGFGVCIENEAQLVEYNDIRGQMDDILTVLGEWNARNCMELETKDEQEACKKTNPFLKNLNAARKKKWDYEGAFPKAIGIKYP